MDIMVEGKWNCVRAENLPNAGAHEEGLLNAQPAQPFVLGVCYFFSLLPHPTLHRLNLPGQVNKRLFCGHPRRARTRNIYSLARHVDDVFADSSLCVSLKTASRAGILQRTRH